MPDLNPKIREQIERQLEESRQLSLPEAVKAAGNGARIKVAEASKRTAADGRVFASKWEMTVYDWLRRMIKPEHLHLQVPFELQGACADDNGKKQQAVRYIADFVISGRSPSDEGWELEDRDVVIDAKGFRTEMFRVKSKLFVGRYHRGIRLARQGHPEDLENIFKEYQSKFRGT